MSTLLNQLIKRAGATDGHPCGYCCEPMFGFGGKLPSTDMRQVTVDHRTPKSRGGSNSADNLVLCCRACNELKGDLTEKEFERLVYWAVGKGARLQKTRKGVKSLKWVASSHGIDVDKFLYDFTI